MKGVSFTRWIATAAMVLSFGCGGQPSNRFSDNALPIAIKLKDAVAKSNTGEVAGQLERAREFHSSRVITEKDLKIFVRLNDLAHDNNWNDVKKVLEEALGER
jgi:hypothetical protein